MVTSLERNNKERADLYNLVPVIDGVNADRSDFQFSRLPKRPTK